MIPNKKILSEKSNNVESKRIRDTSLDFNGIPAGSGIHSIHSYPAMFHPKLVRQLIESYTNPGEYVLDPFMGSGVSAVESSVTGRRFYGFDINPLAILIAKVRTTPIKTKTLENAPFYLFGRGSSPPKKVERCIFIFRGRCILVYHLQTAS